MKPTIERIQELAKEFAGDSVVLGALKAKYPEAFEKYKWRIRISDGCGPAFTYAISGGRGDTSIAEVAEQVARYKYLNKLGDLQDTRKTEIHIGDKVIYNRSGSLYHGQVVRIRPSGKRSPYPYVFHVINSKDGEESKVKQSVSMVVIWEHTNT